MTVENQTPTLHGAEDWCRILDVNVIDPDGWDRRNFTESWAELISEEEFWRRYSRSTVLGGGYRGGQENATESAEPEQVYEEQPTYFERMRHEIADDIIQKMLLAVPPTPNNIAHVRKVAEEYGVEIDFES